MNEKIPKPSSFKYLEIKKRPTQFELGVFLFTFYVSLLTYFTLFFIPHPLSFILHPFPYPLFNISSVT